MTAPHLALTRLRAALRGSALTVALLTIGAAAQAQSSPPAPAIPPSAQPVVPPEKVAPPARLGTGPQAVMPRPGTRTGSVIRPPRAVDPGIAAPPPAAGNYTMPVIPPPANPESNPSGQAR